MLGEMLSAMIANVVEPSTVPLMAETIVVPVAVGLKRPELISIEPTAPLLEDHVNAALNGAPYWSVVLALNWVGRPTVVVEFAGIIVIRARLGGIGNTVSVVVPLMPPLVAEIVVVPGESAVASPDVALIVALEISDEVQVTVAAIGLLNWSRVVAVKAWVVLAIIEEEAAVILIVVRTGTGVTVSSKEPLTRPFVAEIVVVPTDKVVTNPELLTVATALSLELQVGTALKGWLN